MLASRLAEVDLDQEERDVEQDACRDDGREGDTVGTDGNEAEVREEKGKLEAEDAGDVTAWC